MQEIIGLVDDLTASFQPCMLISLQPTVLGYPEKFNETAEGKALIESMRVNYVNTKLQEYLQFLKNQLASSGGPFICGSSITIADCALLPALRIFIRGHLD